MIIAAVHLAACSSLSEQQASGGLPAGAGTQDSRAEEPLSAVTSAWRRAESKKGRAAAGDWLRCATLARSEMANENYETANEAAKLATRCSREFLSQALRSHRSWTQGEQTVAGSRLILELREPSPNLRLPLKILDAEDVSMSMFSGARHVMPGFGVPVALISPRCTDKAYCKLLPPSGVFRTGTAWLEADADDAPPRLVVAHPIRTGALRVRSRSWDLAMDSSAFYAAGMQDSPIRRLSIFGLFGGRELGRRAGMYLLEDYDRQKRPLVMVHGLGSSPMAWARLSNAVWADPELRARYQVWQLVYQTNDPVLVARLRVQGHLDEAWRLLDPEGDDPARRGIVLVGHSMGGVVCRLLLVDTGNALWSTAFNRPPSTLVGEADDLVALDRMFRFSPYPGVQRAVLLAAPHQGSPTADAFLGRLAHLFVGRRTPEIQALQRIAQLNQSVVPEDLRKPYLRGSINSITTLRRSEPVMNVARSLRSSPGIPYHTIAGHLPGTLPPSDGVVPLQSALLAGSSSELIIASGHNVHEQDDAIAEVLRILHENSSALPETSDSLAPKDQAKGDE